MAPLSALRFLREQTKTLPAPVKRDLTGKVVIVTGSNVYVPRTSLISPSTTNMGYSGLGYEAAKHLATLNPARLIIACRSISKGEEAAGKITAATGTKVDVWQLDLSNLTQTKSFGERCLQELDRLDIFVSSLTHSSRTGFSG
jgi:retinol dehydrogenase-12